MGAKDNVDGEQSMGAGVGSWGRQAWKEGEPVPRVTEEAVVHGRLLGPGDFMRCVSELYAFDPRVASSLALLGGMCVSAERGSVSPSVASG